MFDRYVLNRGEFALEIVLGLPKWLLNKGDRKCRCDCKTMAIALNH